MPERRDRKNLLEITPDRSLDPATISCSVGLSRLPTPLSVEDINRLL